MTGTVYKIRRKRNILQFTLALEKLGYVRIMETGHLKLPVELLLPEQELDDTGILKVFKREDVNLSTPEKDLKALLDKLLKERMNNGSVV